MKITKKEYSEFIQGAKTIVEKIIPTCTPSIKINRIVFEIETKIGKLSINIRTDYNSDLYSIFCRFDEVEKYSKLESSRINYYSGKWNFHHTNKNIILELFENELKEIVL